MANPIRGKKRVSFSFFFASSARAYHERGGGIRGINGAAVRETLLFVCPAGGEGAMGGGSRRGEAQESSCALTYFFWPICFFLFPILRCFPERGGEGKSQACDAAVRLAAEKSSVFSCCSPSLFPMFALPISPIWLLHLCPRGTESEPENYCSVSYA